MDILRLWPFRWIGYSYVFGELINVHNEQQESPSEFLAITLFYVSGHAILTGSLASWYLHNHPEEFDLPSGIFYVFFTPIETLLWDCVASVVLPYCIGMTAYWIFDRCVCGGFQPTHAVRRFVPPAIGIISVAIFGPLVDLSTDFFLDSLLPLNRYKGWKESTRFIAKQ